MYSECDENNNKNIGKNISIMN